MADEQNLDFDSYDRHQYEKELITQRAIVDSTTDLIWSVSSDNFGLLTFNKSLQEYFLNGRGIKIKVGDRPEELFPAGEYVDLWHNLYNKALKDGSFTQEYLVYNKTRVLQLNFNILQHGNVVFGVSVFGKDITAQKKAEGDALKARANSEEREKQLQALFDNLSDGIGISKDGISYLVNSAYVEMFGYTTADEITGKSLLNMISPKEHERLKHYIANRYKDKNLPKYYETIGIKENGEEFPLEILVGTYVINNANYSFGILRNITQRKQIKQELISAKENAEINELKLKKKNEEIEFNNQRLESLLKISQLQTQSLQELLDYALNEAINLTDSKIGYIYFYNEATKQFILNTWSKDVMKECRVMHPQTTYDLDKTGCWGEAVRQRKPIIINNYEDENPMKKGTPHGHVALKKFLTIPVVFDNKIVAVAGVANKESDYDNSDVRQLTLLMDSVWKISERILLINDLQIAKEKAEESNQLKSSFLQNMSHEVRTPLNAISGFSQLISKPNQSPERLKKYSDMILESSNKLIEIITDVVEISQIQSKIAKSKFSKIETIALLNSIIVPFKNKAKEKNIDLLFTVNIPFQEYYILTDEDKLRRIICHLIDNSIKFTIKGCININCEIENENLKLLISDTGIGISAEMQKVVFEPFRQVETGVCRNFGGNGLGLSLVKAYIELLGGSISLESEVNKGTTVRVFIPINKDSSHIDGSLPINKTYQANTILIVEDEYSNYQYLLALLEENKFNILYAANGQEAIDLCRSNSAIDLILMDIKMPIMDGYTAGKLIKSFRTNLPIIAQTAYALEVERETFIGIFDDYITKPISGEMLNQKIFKLIEK